MSSEYPRPHKFDLLGPAARGLSRVPRYARLIAQLVDMHPEGSLELETEAAVFWMVYNHIARNPQDVTGLLDDGLKATEAQNFGWHRGGTPERKERTIRLW